MEADQEVIVRIPNPLPILFQEFSGKRDISAFHRKHWLQKATSMDTSTVVLLIHSPRYVSKNGVATFTGIPPANTDGWLITHPSLTKDEVFWLPTGWLQHMHDLLTKEPYFSPFTGKWE